MAPVGPLIRLVCGRSKFYCCGRSQPVHPPGKAGPGCAVAFAVPAGGSCRTMSSGPVPWHRCGDRVLPVVRVRVIDQRSRDARSCACTSSHLKRYCPPGVVTSGTSTPISTQRAMVRGETLRRRAMSRVVSKRASSASIRATVGVSNVEDSPLVPEDCECAYVSDVAYPRPPRSRRSRECHAARREKHRELPPRPPLRVLRSNGPESGGDYPRGTKRDDVRDAVRGLPR